MTAVRRLAVGAALGLLVAAGALLLWPMHGNGLSGNAVHPHYSDFGWYSYAALPAHPTTADFRAAGVTTPQDVVHDRRLEAGIVAVTGAALLSAAALSGRRRAGLPRPQQARIPDEG